MNIYIHNLINKYGDDDDCDDYDDYEQVTLKPNVIKLYNELVKNRQIMVLSY